MLNNIHVKRIEVRNVLKKNFFIIILPMCIFSLDHNFHLVLLLLIPVLFPSTAKKKPTSAHSLNFSCSSLKLGWQDLRFTRNKHHLVAKL